MRNTFSLRRIRIQPAMMRFLATEGQDMWGLEVDAIMNSLGVAVVYLAVFIDMLGVSLVLPVLPFLALEFGASSALIGVVFSSYAAAQALSVLFMGPLSDKYGRRPAIMLSLLGSSIGFLMQGFATSIESFIAWRAMAGLFGGSPPIAQAFVSDVFDDARRPHYLALIGSVTAMAFLFGPGMGAGLSEFSLQTPLFVASALSFASLLLAHFYLPESNPRILQELDLTDASVHMDTPHMDPVSNREPVPSSRGPEHSDELADSEEMKTESKSESVEASHQDVAKDRGLAQEQKPTQEHENEDEQDKAEETTFNYVVILVCTAGFANGSAFASVQSMFALYAADEFGLESLQIGFVFVGMALVFILAQAFIFGRMLQRFGLLQTATVGALLNAVGLSCLPVTSSLAFSCFFAGVSGLGYSLIVPAVPSLLSRMAGVKQRGQLLSYGQSTSALSRVIAPVLYGALYEEAVAIPFAVAGGFAVLCAVFFSVLSVWDTGLYHLKMQAEPSVTDSEHGVEQTNDTNAVAAAIGLAADQPIITRISEFREIAKSDLRLSDIHLTPQELIFSSEYGVAIAKILKSRHYTRMRWPEATEVSHFMSLVLPDLTSIQDDEVYRTSMLRVLNSALGIGQYHNSEMAHM